MGVGDGSALDAGSWRLAVDDHQHPVAKIAPPAVPMFQQVVEFLETKPVPPGGAMKREDEARAAVTVCLRFGSYFAVLSDPSRPDAPDIADEEVSHIANQEMARINIEVSAALAWWLALRGADNRAIGILSIGRWRTCPQDRRPSAPWNA